MKLTVILLVAFQMSVYASAFSQTKVSLNLKDATIEEFISMMKVQTETQFLYNASLMQSTKRVDVEATQEDLFSVLDRVLPMFRMTYDLVNDVVVLKKLPQTQTQTNERWVVTGKIIDTKGNPLPGVTIRLKGTTVGTASNVAGTFSLNVPHVKDTLIVSFIGMKMKEVSIEKGKKEQYEIVLEEETEALEEVQVISTGYQDIDRRRLTSSVTSVKIDDINVAGITSVDKLLEGRIPGMLFMQLRASGSCTQIAGPGNFHYLG